MMIEQRACIGDKIIQIKCIESDSIPYDHSVLPAKIDDNYYFEIGGQAVLCSKHDVMEFKYTKQSTMKQFKGWAFRYNDGEYRGSDKIEVYTAGTAEWMVSSGLAPKPFGRWVAVYE